MFALSNAVGVGNGVGEVVGISGGRGNIGESKEEVVIMIVPFCVSYNT